MRLKLGLAAIAAAALAAPGVAQAYPPLDAPGPALSVAPPQVEANMECSPGVQGASRAPVLLLHGTGSNSHSNWSWNYIPAFNSAGIPWCTLDSPAFGNDDVQVNGEYVVYAIRKMFTLAGRRISIIGHSQGGMLPRWALRFWPDTRAMVDDVIAYAATNHGTTQARLTCVTECAAAGWQQRDDSKFIAALNSGQETFAGISYTNVYTRTDETVQPNADDTGSTSLHTGPGEITNVATQDICPLEVYEHLMIGTISPTAYALALDALSHPGPAVESSVSPLVCVQVLMPGINPLSFPFDALAAFIDLYSAPSTDVPAEPPLRCYATGTCPAASAPPAQSAAPASPAKSKKAKKKRKRKGRKKKRKRGSGRSSRCMCASRTAADSAPSSAGTGTARSPGASAQPAVTLSWPGSAESCWHTGSTMSSSSVAKAAPSIPIRSTSRSGARAERCRSGGSARVSAGRSSSRWLGAASDGYALDSTDEGSGRSSPGPAREGSAHRSALTAASDSAATAWS